MTTTKQYAIRAAKEILSLLEEEGLDEEAASQLNRDLATELSIIKTESEGYRGLSYISDSRARELYLASMPKNAYEERCADADSFWDNEARCDLQ